MKKQAKTVFFKAVNGKWRWKLVASNGRIICTPGEEFSSKRKAINNLLLVQVALIDL